MTLNMSDQTSSSDDIALLSRVAARDRRAFEQLYMQYHRRLYQFLLRMTHAPDTTEELLNDVMYVVWQKAGDFKGESKVSTWILGIAYRKALKEYDRSRRRVDTTADDLLPEASDPAWHACPEQHLAHREFSQQLSESISALGFAQRSVVELTALGHTYKEISTILNCPENTVKTRMFHARKYMKQHIAQRLSQARANQQ